MNSSRVLVDCFDAIKLAARAKKHETHKMTLDEQYQIVTDLRDNVYEKIQSVDTTVQFQRQPLLHVAGFDAA